MKASSLANPDAYRREVEVHPSTHIAMHKRMANYYYTNPFTVLAAAGVVAVGTIFSSKSSMNSLSFSQRVMQTRVQGQFTVVTILLGTFAFMEWMNRRGGEFTE